MTLHVSDLTQPAQAPPQLTTRQMGWPLLVLSGIIAVVLLLRVASGSSLGIPPWLAIVGGAAAAMLLAVFSTLTVRVWPDRVEWAFGPGWPRWTVPLEDIRAVDAVRYSFWWGYGIRRTRSGWLYNVSGQHAVRLKLPKGRAVSIGVNDARQVARAIEDARRHGRPLPNASAGESGELTHRALTQRFLS